MSGKYYYPIVFGFTYFFATNLRGGLRAGYNVGYKGTLHLSGDSSSTLVDNNGKNINTDWTGFSVLTY